MVNKQTTLPQDHQSPTDHSQNRSDAYAFYSSAVPDIKCTETDIDTRAQGVTDKRMAKNMDKIKALNKRAKYAKNGTLKNIRI